MMDDFAIEMREHFLKTCYEVMTSPESLKSSGASLDTKERLLPLLKEWIPDATANELVFFGRFLSMYETNLKSAGVASEVLEGFYNQCRVYLKHLVEGGPDSEEVFNKVMGAVKGKQLFLLCYAGLSQFVIPIKNVVEVVTTKPVYSLPDKRSAILGMMSYRGESVPVINLVHYGFDMKDDHGAKLQIILDVSGLKCAIEATQTADVIELQDEDFRHDVDGKMISRTPFVDEFILREERTVLVFNLEKMVAA